MDPVAFFREERWTAGVIGLGYVGLPLLATLTERGLGCIGFDVSQQRVEDLDHGRSPVEDVTDEELQAALEEGLEVTTDRSRLSEADAVFICVPSPLDRVRQPDLSYIHAAAETVSKVARAGQLVVLESTTYPGTTDEVIVPAATGNQLQLDEDVFVAFSPERIDPGNPMKSGDLPKVVGGVTQRSGEVAAAAYGRIVPDVHVVSTARAAELTKLLENTYRSVNIARENIEEQGFRPVLDGELGGWTAAVVLTDHDGVDYEAIADAVTFTFDTRGVYRRLGIERSDVVAL